ncbi:MAG: sigma-54 dependent transcriptional regulator [bacterium]|nr:sigma-54 dependent transcriptional regulator [bacterium]
MIKKILIVDDEEGVRYSFKRFLNDPIYRIVQAQNGKEALLKFNSDNFDLIILDVRLPDLSGLEVLKKIKTLDPKMVVLIMTAYGTTEVAIEATKLGAYDYIIKPFSIPDIKKIIDEALYCSHLMREQVVLDPAIKNELKGDRMIGNSPMMQEVYKMIGRVAGMDVNILIRGESGTGKELVARAIYQHSHRSQKQFLAVNCAAIPETLLESELFGYEKGAFTGATHRKIGKFEQVNGGTIFLDEIGDMSLSTQAKILRVLQEGCFERLGSDQTIKVDIRIIAATNRNLETEIEDGRFREDLYYRIKVVTITLPPLRFREQDIGDLIDYFFEKHAATFNKHGISISPQAVEKMKNYHWPGNIRELENIIKCAIVLCKGNVITEDLIVEEFQPVTEANAILAKANSGFTNFNQLVKQYDGRLYEKVISQTEKTMIEQVLKHTSGNQVQAANILGISRVMLRERIEKYNIKKQIIIQ